MYDLTKFVEGYRVSFEAAKQELVQGQKQSHWMWYIFPQLKGLGKSEMSQYYGLVDADEAKAFIDNEYLGAKIIELFKIVNKMPDYDYVLNCFGPIDILKLRSCATLFLVATNYRVFRKTIYKFFNGKKDLKTLRILKGKRYVRI